MCLYLVLSPLNWWKEMIKVISRNLRNGVSIKQKVWHKALNLWIIMINLKWRWNYYNVVGACYTRQFQRHVAISLLTKLEDQLESLLSERGAQKIIKVFIMAHAGLRARDNFCAWNEIVGRKMSGGKAASWNKHRLLPHSSLCLSNNLGMKSTWPVSYLQSRLWQAGQDSFSSWKASLTQGVHQWDHSSCQLPQQQSHGTWSIRTQCPPPPPGHGWVSSWNSIISIDQRWRSFWQVLWKNA